MREWFSLTELAALRLPGLPETREGWAHIADREGWRRRKDYRGRWLTRVESGCCGDIIQYHIGLLPGATLLCYVAENVCDGVESDRFGDARRFIVECADRIASYGFSQRLADRFFAACYSLGKAHAPPSVVREVPKVAGSTISAWRTDVRREDAEIREALERAWRYAPGKVRAAFVGAHCSGAGV